METTQLGDILIILLSSGFLTTIALAFINRRKEQGNLEKTIAETKGEDADTASTLVEIALRLSEAQNVERQKQAEKVEKLEKEFEELKKEFEETVAALKRENAALKREREELKKKVSELTSRLETLENLKSNGGKGL